MNATMDTDRLHEAFQSFAAASKSLETSYGLLQEKVRQLTAELDAKNRRVHELEIQHERNERLIAMGEMAAKIVHEIRNPLCSVELYATMLERDLRGTGHRDLAAGISSGISSLNTILTNMLIFARPNRPALRDIRLDSVVSDSIALVLPHMEMRNARLESSLYECEVRGDPELLKQVFMNVLINAVQAMHSGGTVSVSMRNGGGAVSVDVRDDGEGIPREDMERIFDPFFSTKESGTGLGLAIASRIMQAHNGSITVESTPGRGSLFRLTFPRPAQ